jgi:hypothetical protein
MIHEDSLVFPRTITRLVYEYTAGSVCVCMNSHSNAL